MNELLGRIGRFGDATSMSLDSFFQIRSFLRPELLMATAFIWMSQKITAQKGIRSRNLHEPPHSNVLGIAMQNQNTVAFWNRLYAAKT